MGLVLFRFYRRKIMGRREIATENFHKGYNCSQAVALAFNDLMKLDESTLLKLSSSFGGGIGRMREVCGTVSGMAMVLGVLYGFDASTPGEEKTAHYARIQEVCKKFEEQNGSIICRELLGLNVKNDSPVPEKRTPEYYKKRPCDLLCGDAAEILEEYINNHPLQ